MPCWRCRSSTHDGYIIQLLNIAILNAIVVLGLNFATGWTGQINFGQAAFYGLGAYTTAIATKAGLPWIATPLLSIMVVVAASLVLGLPTLRLRTYYLAMTTIGFGEIVRLIIVHWEPVTGGTSGLRAIPGISLFGFGPQGQIQHYYLLIAVLALAALVASRIRNSTLGRAMIATRDSEIAAEQSGVDTTRTKLLAFMIGAVYAGLAGCLYASSIRFISPDSFSGIQAILLMTMLIVGGMGSIAGCIIGAVALTLAARGAAVPRAMVSRALWPWRDRRDRAGAGRPGLACFADYGCAGRVRDDRPIPSSPRVA